MPLYQPECVFSEASDVVHIIHRLLSFENTTQRTQLCIYFLCVNVLLLQHHVELLHRIWYGNRFLQQDSTSHVMWLLAACKHFRKSDDQHRVRDATFCLGFDLQVCSALTTCTLEPLSDPQGHITQAAALVRVREQHVNAS